MLGKEELGVPGNSGYGILIDMLGKKCKRNVQKYFGTKSQVAVATISAFSEHLTPRPLGPLSGRNDSSCVSLHGLRVANPHKPFGNQAPHTFGCHFEVALLQ